MKVVQIVPRFTPQVCGVGDHATVLSERLLSDHGIASQFAVSSPLWAAAEGAEKSAHPPFKLARSANAAARQLMEAGGESMGIVVQYSGYGLATRGAPYWLPLALRRFQRRNPKVPIVTMFHELATRGSWKTSSFWNWPVQRWVLAELIRLSRAAVFTNREEYGRQLHQLAGGQIQNFAVLPVFSNFGELDQADPGRPHDLAWFGWPMSPELEKRLQEWLLTTVQRFGIRTLHVFRHPLPEYFQLPVPVEFHGLAPPEKVSAILRRCRYAFSDYPYDYMGKSSLFAAFAAHHLVTVLRNGVGALPDHLKVGEHLLSLDDPATFGDDASQERVAAAAHQWYRTHDRATAAAHYAKFIRNGVLA